MSPLKTKYKEVKARALPHIATWAPIFAILAVFSIGLVMGYGFSRIQSKDEQANMAFNHQQEIIRLQQAYGFKVGKAADDAQKAVEDVKQVLKEARDDNKSTH